MNGYSILVVDDEVQIRRLLKVGLETEGVKFLEAATGEEALREVANQKPDLVLLDLGLPGISGLEVIERIREWSKVPIIVLSVQEDEAAKVEALDRGADDYLEKPFGMPELLARIRVALRHSHSTSEPNSIFKSGAIEVDFGAHLVKKNGEEVHLTSTEFRLFTFLIQNEGKVVTHRQIVKAVWGANQDNDLAYLRIYIRSLRQKIELDPTSPTLIKTEPGVGYRLRKLTKDL